MSKNPDDLDQDEEDEKVLVEKAELEAALNDVELELRILRKQEGECKLKQLQRRMSRQRKKSPSGSTDSADEDGCDSSAELEPTPEALKIRQRLQEAL